MTETSTLMVALNPSDASIIIFHTWTETEKQSHETPFYLTKLAKCKIRNIHNKLKIKEMHRLKQFYIQIFILLIHLDPFQFSIAIFI